jgi:excisionase family DNA binding protein
MNNAVLQDFTEALQLVEGDRTAAAQLALASALRDWQSPTTDKAPADQPLTVKEAAAKLRISPRRVYEMCAGGELRAFKIGRSLRIPPEALEECRQQGRTAARRRQSSFGGRANRCL